MADKAEIAEVVSMTPHETRVRKEEEVRPVLEWLAGENVRVKVEGMRPAGDLISQNRMEVETGAGVEFSVAGGEGREPERFGMGQLEEAVNYLLEWRNDSYKKLPGAVRRIRAGDGTMLGAEPDGDKDITVRLTDGEMVVGRKTLNQLRQPFLWWYQYGVRPSEPNKCMDLFNYDPKTNYGGGSGNVQSREAS